ncbi:hypothetical protein Q8791_12495 [Nocardiopsis sp. CT-R113]|uniref:Secreted protein n=1 Tax=Nocardiopsis codii TaxID=3065942 RepID=A0ABU7K725_9ACTN|nr:hypothetical protein [Nocardiopsis sp. CT-R113]MEE2038035.1 hypothetical protein [Nocardiopsis sp. CT-R113]
MRRIAVTTLTVSALLCGAVLAVPARAAAIHTCAQILFDEQSTVASGLDCESNGEPGPGEMHSEEDGAMYACEEITPSADRADATGAGCRPLD